MSELIGIREAARRLGVSDTAVHKAIKVGRVTVHSRTEGSNRPLLDWEAAKAQWEANSDSSKRSHVGPSAAGSPTRAKYAGKPEVALPVSSSGAGPGTSTEPRQPPAPAEDSGDVAKAAGGGPSYAQSRAVREAYSARLQKLEYDERIGKLVDVDQVKMEAFKTHRRVRDAILNIPDRCSPQLAVLTDPAEVHIYLLGEIVAVLRQLSSDIYRPGSDAK